MAAQYTEEDLMAMHLPELKDIAKSVNVKTSGKKDEIVGRILTKGNEPAGAGGEDDLYNWKAKDLSEMCKARGLPSSGTKDELVARLTAPETDESKFMLLKLDDLKEMCRANSLPPTGKKADLVNRLLEAGIRP